MVGGMSTEADNTMLSWDNSVFLGGDRQRRCLGSDLLWTMWCFDVHQVRYLHNGLRKYSLTVLCRNPRIVGSRSNSLCFFVSCTHTHVSIEICIFRCLVGHVFQRYGPGVRNVCRTMVNMYQVMISPDFICKIHILCLTVLHCNERSCNCIHT